MVFPIEVDHDINLLWVFIISQYRIPFTIKIINLYQIYRSKIKLGLVRSLLFHHQIDRTKRLYRQLDRQSQVRLNRKRNISNMKNDVQVVEKWGIEKCLCYARIKTVRMGEGLKQCLCAWVGNECICVFVRE